MSSVFVVGLLVYYCFCIVFGSVCSCIILVFYCVVDNLGWMVSDVEDSLDVFLSELLIRGVFDEFY